MLEDAELLKQFAGEGSEAAFAELVRRRIDLVYSVALRHVAGDTYLAEDVTQQVFVDLAKKARPLSDRFVLSGWLFRSTQFAASRAVRTERRRRAREQEAEIMKQNLPESDPEWERLRPFLDEAMGALGERDRDAVALRFFEARSFAEIGAVLRLTEEAARKRVERALERMHAALVQRGIGSTTAALGAALAGHVAVAAPMGLATTVTGVAVGSTSAGAAAIGGLILFMSMSKLQIATVAGLALAAAVGIRVQATGNTDLRREISAMSEQKAVVTALREENEKLAASAAEVAALRHDDLEFKLLAQRVAEAQQAAQANKARDDQMQATLAQLDRRATTIVGRLNLQGKELVKQHETLGDRARDSSLATEERLRAEAAAKEKLEEIQAKQRELGAFTQVTRNLLQRFIEAGTGRWPNADPMKLSLIDAGGALLAYENYLDMKIIRDPALANFRGVMDVQFGSPSKEDTVQFLQAALRDQLNIVLEKAADGSLVARPGPPR